MPEEEIDAVIVALHEGVFEDPCWTTFLEKIRHVTRADYVRERTTSALYFDDRTSD